MNIIDFKTFVNEAKRLSGSLVMKDRKKMRRLLRENILTFKFQKRDGTIRRAIGTLFPDLLPPIKGTGGPKPEYQMVYYDLEKLEWRSFRSFKFIKIVKSVPITDDIVEKYKKEIKDEMRRREEEKKHSTSHTEKKEETREEHKEKTHEVEKKHEEHKPDKTHEVEKKHEEHKPEEKHEDAHDHEQHKVDKKHEEHKSEEPVEKKTFKAGEKIPEKELVRRSADFRKGSRKNKTTREANDAFKKESSKD